MYNVLPQLPPATGLVVDGVIYRYTVNKNVNDPFTVTIQNKNLLGEGNIFQSTDDWSGLPGNSIIKLVPVDNISYRFWGDGSASTTGQGSIKDLYVLYNYKYDDTCLDPLNSPICPGWADAFLRKYSLDNPSAYDPLTDPNVLAGIRSPTDLDSEEVIKRKQPIDPPKDSKRRDIRKEATNNMLLTDAALNNASELQALNNLYGWKSYEYTIPGGKYPDGLRYKSKKLPDNNRALLMNMRQDRVHQEMVDAQYK